MLISIVSQQTHQRWCLVENESWTDVHLTTLFQDWQNDVETTLIELGWFNVVEPTLFQRWNLVENESWADVCLSTLFQRWQNNNEATLKEFCRFNVDDPMLFQCWYLVEKESSVNIYSSTLRKQHWNNLVNICNFLLRFETMYWRHKNNKCTFLPWPTSFSSKHTYFMDVPKKS